MSIIESIIKNIFFREKKHLAMSYEKEINRCIDLVGRNHNEAWHNREKILEAMNEAENRHGNLDWIKFKARFLLAKKIAKALPWEADTVHDYYPEWAPYGIVPNYGNGVNGDSQGWSEVYEMPDGTEVEIQHPGQPRNGSRPADLQAWADNYLNEKRQEVTAKGGKHKLNRPSFLPSPLDKDPNSNMYKCECLRNYWGDRMFSFAGGKHPRTPEARAAWLKSNGGEYESYIRGKRIEGNADHWVYNDSNEKCEIYRISDGAGGYVWQVNYAKKYLLKAYDTYRLGYEIDNAKYAYPRKGFERRACVTWGRRPAIM